MANRATGASVLLVDDNPDMRVLWRLVIALDGAFDVVHEASDGAAALEKLHRFSPDVIVTDYSMPGVSGLAVVDAALAHRPDTVVVLTSNTYDIRAEALRRGASAFMSKYDSTSERLPALLHQLVGEARSDVPRRPCGLGARDGRRNASQSPGAESTWPLRSSSAGQVHLF